MARIDRRLFERLQTRLGVSRRRVYEMIEQRMRESLLDRPHAALALALEHGLNISRYATSADWEVLRQYRTGSGSSSGPVARGVASPPSVGSRARGLRSANTRKKGPKNKIFVIHGRNTKLKTELHVFLRAIGLEPIEWSHALRLSRKGSAHVSEIVGAAFKEAEAFVVLLTPDDEARLRPEFWKSDEEPYEKRLTRQARPNVLFEAGMAFGSKPDSTVVVQVGKVKPFSDVVGRHLVHLNNSPEKRKELVIKLQAAGCRVNDSGTDWINVGDFSLK